MKLSAHILACTGAPRGEWETQTLSTSEATFFIPRQGLLPGGGWGRGYPKGCLGPEPVPGLHLEAGAGNAALYSLGAGTLPLPSFHFCMAGWLAGWLVA